MSARDDLAAHFTSDTLADQLLDAYRAEVLREGADAINALPQDYECDPGRGDSAELLRVMAGATEEKASATAPTATPDFFRPGQTYSEPGDVTDWRFRCDSITTHPEDGERTALGWRHFRGEWEPYAYGEGDFEIHQVADAIGATEDGA